LDEDPELGVEVKGAGLAVVEELLVNGKLHVSSGAAARADDVLEVDGDGAEEPQEDDVIHPSPTGKGGGSDVESGVVVVALQRQQDEVAPTDVVGGGDNEDDGDQGPDIMDVGGLGVEAGDGGLVEASNVSSTSRRGGKVLALQRK
jgi:hypothetical protein